MNSQRSLLEQANALAEQGNAAAAAAMLEDGVGRGDADACFALAAWSLAGRWIDRDLGRSRQLFGEAASHGHDAARAIHIAFLANGTGGDRAWAEALALLRVLSTTDTAARRQLELIDAMKLAGDGGPTAVPDGKMLDEACALTLFEAAFSHAECDYLIEAAAPFFQTSTVVHPTTGRQIPDPVRTSDVAAFPLARENPAVHALNRRIAALSGTEATQGEPLQVLRYRAGQEYRLHSDALPNADNQRILTVLVYLNDQYDGGETRFPASGLSVRGRPGDAIMFSNVDARGLPDPGARHIGTAVTRGVKFLGSRWIRQAPLDLARTTGS